ncbi:MAG TPA: 30S ribosome-binding factor RbfA [Terriglobales bacterium]|nr:30S ribosome-binding factor RbfA [Terriglobales bacterium]
MEHRQQQHHRARVAEALREEVTSIVEGELSDPRVAGVSVSDFHLSGDGKTVRVFVTVHGEEDEGERALAGLGAAKGYIRRELVARLGLRQSPELIFELDRSQQCGARIDELLRRAGKRKR